MPAVDVAAEPFTIRLRSPRVVFGDGVAASELASELDLLAADRVLLVASERERKARADVLGPLGSRIVGHVEEVRRHVPRRAADAALHLALELEADCLLSIGGGSAVGTAKAVALDTGLPIVALPTTYAGSELTPIYGITEDATKRTGRSDLVLPRTVLLDPALSRGLPGDLTRVSAINAVAHCVSGVFAAGRSPVTDLLASEGLRLLSRGLRGLASDGETVHARADLSQGAYLAGTVLAHAGTSAHHTICHILGGAFDLPHAETHTAVLPAASAFLRERNPAAAAPLESVLGSLLEDGLCSLYGDAGIAVRLREIGLAEHDLDRAAALLEGGDDHPGVPGLDAARAERLLRDAW